MNDKTKLPKACQPFAFHDVEFTRHAGSGEWIADCPYCGKANHFYVSGKDGRFQCKVCEATGNVITFLTDVATWGQEKMTELRWKHLCASRGLPKEAFDGLGIGFDGTRYQIPVYSRNGKTVHTIRLWSPKTKMLSTSGRELVLYLQHELVKAPQKAIVWVCEGEGDAIALRWMLKRLERLYDVVVGVPGAQTFKDEWVEMFVGRHVRLCYDHDLPGAKGRDKAISKLVGVAASLEVLVWPDDVPVGHDVRDHVVAHKKDLRQGLAKLEGMLKPAEVPVDTQRFEVLDAAELKKRPKPELLVEPLLPRNSLVVLFGEPGCGKSFTTLHLAALINSGKTWANHKVQQGRVVYIAAEGCGGLGVRLRAWEKHHDLSTDGLRFIIQTPNLLDRSDVEALIAALKSFGPDLVVVDTLGRASVFDTSSKCYHILSARK